MFSRSRDFCSSLLVWISLAQAAFAQSVPVKTADLDGPSIGRRLKYQIVLPIKYDNKTERFPVLYLLHGYSGNYTQWARFRAAQVARKYDLIVVMPDGGNSWYINWAQSDDGQKNAWEDYIVKDVVGHIDSTYRTIARREGRAINGLSMGGYGSLVVGLRNPDKFCSIASHSGALEWARQAAKHAKNGEVQPADRSKIPVKSDPRIGVPEFSNQDQRTPRGRMFVTLADCAAHDPFGLVLKTPRDKLPAIHFDCGTEDPFFPATDSFVKLLLENKIPFTYFQSPGEHKGAYWSREIERSIAIQYAVMRTALAAP